LLAGRRSEKIAVVKHVKVLKSSVLRRIMGPKREARGKRKCMMRSSIIFVFV
jgi:hypothetical protein